MGKRKIKKSEIVNQNISPEEEQYRYLFDFAHYLENLTRGPVSGATQLLRVFLAEKKEKNG
jgi:hypothetical protein